MVIICNCGSEPISLEARTPGKNRGRWYLKCPTGTCGFFKWDDSPLSFIKHPVHAYAAQQPLSGATRSFSKFNFRATTKDTELSLTKTKVHVIFSVISKSLIGIRVQSNLTLDSVIAKIDNIQWSAEYDQWTIPASVPIYNMAIASLPTDTPNLQIEIEPIPPALLDAIIEMRLLESSAAHYDTDRMSDIELKWSQFVESSMWSILQSSIQKEAVGVGIERRGRILLGNENGIGSIAEALALTKVYQDEWPVLVSCPAVLCLTWKQEIMCFLGLDEHAICILDPAVPKSEMFKKMGVLKQQQKDYQQKDQQQQKKRKLKSLTPKIRQPYKKRMEQKLQLEHYDSSSSSSSSEDEDQDQKIESGNTVNSYIKFYIASHEHTAKRRKEIACQKFKIMLCADSHYLKSWTKGESKFICKLLQDHPKAILISDLARDALPVNLYTQLQALEPTLFPKFELFAKRYCGCKSTVFGWSYNGRCNQEEFRYLLDANIWYCPTLKELKPEFPQAVRQSILLSVKKSDVLRKQVEHMMALEDQVDEKQNLIQDLHKKTANLKKDEINLYLEYALDTFKKPKIAIVYYNNQVYKSMEQHLKKKDRVKLIHINDLDTAMDKSEQYNKSNSVQIITLDMKLEDLNISLHSVDLVIFTELPFDMDKTSEIEALFKFNDRKGPLSIKYLIAPDTIDDYLWPLVKTS